MQKNTSTVSKTKNNSYLSKINSTKYLLNYKLNKPVRKLLKFVV